MDSSSILVEGVGGPWADPYLWCGAAALFVGLAAALALRACRRDEPEGRRPARFALAIVYLSLGILALAGLFMLADKGGISETWSSERPVLLVSCGALFAAGVCAGSKPLVLGLPVAAIIAAAFAGIGLGIAGWLPLRSDGSGEVAVARLLPYKVDQASFSGQLELPERDSIPVVQDLNLAASAVGVRVECLELREPLRLAACMVSARARSSSPSWSRALSLYRIAGLVGTAPPSKAIGADFRGPAFLFLVDLALRLSPDAGMDPGSPPTRSSAFFGLARRTRSTSSCASLVPLRPVTFDLSTTSFAAMPREHRY